MQLQVNPQMSYYTSVIIMTLLALTVLSILISENDRITYQKKRLFIYTNILIAAAAIAECAGVHINGNANIPKGVLAAVKAVDYTLTPMSGGALIALMQKPNTKSWPLRWLFIGNAIFQVISAFQGWMIVIDDQNHYVHGPLYPAYMALYSLIIVIVMVRMLSYGKSFRKQNRKSLYATILLVFVGIIIQELFGHDLRVSYLALTFGVAFLFIHYSEFYQLQLDDTISEQKIKISKDILTGVLSRMAYTDTIKAYANCIPDDLAVFLIDVNGLKAANDSLGHDAGDELIRGAAQCIAHSIGKKGRTFRIGGDEFVVLADMTREQANEALISLKQTTDRWSGQKNTSLSVSAGFALSKDFEGCSIHELVKEADKAMYAQKKAYYQISGHDRRDNRQF